MATTKTEDRSALRYLIVAGVLLVLLAALGLLYWQLVKPPAVTSGAAGNRDRNYLFSIYGFEGDLLRRPSSVGVAANGNIYVADTGKRRVVVFDERGEFVTTYGEVGQEPLKLWEPIDVAVAPDGRSFVLDKGQKKVVQFSSARKAQKEIKFEEHPLSLTIKGDRIYVTTDSGVLVGDLDGNLVTGYVAKGQKPGQFDKPGGVAVDDQGNLYVADSFNYRVQAISKAGKPMWQYGSPIPADKAIQFNESSRKFGLPASITMDDNGRLYVVDGVNGEVVVLDKDGEFQERIGDVGHEDGTFYYPDGIDQAAGRLVIADKFNDRIQVFRVPVTGVAAWVSFAPWLLLLPLLLLPLLLLRRRPDYFATPAFVEIMAADENGPVVAKAIRRLTVSPALAERGRAAEDLKIDWRAREAAEADVSALMERFELDEQQAFALALAAGARGKRALLTEEYALREAAAQLNVPMLAYHELRDAVAKPAAAEPQGGEA